MLPVGCSVSKKSQGSALVETADLPMGSPSFSVSSSLSLFQSQGSPMSVHCLGVNICIYLSQLLVGPLGGQSCQALVCKHSIARVIVTDLGASTWDLSQFAQSQDHLFLRLFSIFVTAVFHIRTILSDSFLLGMSTRDSLSFYQRWTLQVHSPPLCGISSKTP